MFADVTKLYHAIKSKDDCDILQQNLAIGLVVNYHNHL